MRARSGSLCIAARKIWRSPGLAAAVLLFLGSAAWAGGQASSDPNAPALRLIKIIPINGTAASPNTKLFSFDISWVDNANNGLYYLADRSNAALDVVDTTGAFTGTPDTLFGQIGGHAPGQANFKGDTGTTATSGPDGVVAAFPCIFAGDGDSRLLSFNGAVSFTDVVSALNTGGQFRVDEMAVDPADRLILATNNAETLAPGRLPPCHRTTRRLARSQIRLKPHLMRSLVAIRRRTASSSRCGTRRPKRFYVSLPEIDGPGDGTGPNGAVARITTSGVIETIYPINFMQPAGLTVGPNGDLLVGSNSVFDTSGKKCTAVVPAPSPTTGTAAQMAPAHPATCTGIAFPQVAICNPGRGCTPANGSLVSVSGRRRRRRSLFQLGRRKLLRHCWKRPGRPGIRRRGVGGQHPDPARADAASHPGGAAGADGGDQDYTD